MVKYFKSWSKQNKVTKVTCIKAKGGINTKRLEYKEKRLTETQKCKEVVQIVQNTNIKKISIA